MNTVLFVVPLISVGVFLVGLWLGLRNGRSTLQSQLVQAVDAERRSAEARETGLREQIDAARREVTELRPKAEELAASRQKLADEEAKYAQMKGELDSAFKSAAADALRANTQSFLALARQELSGQTQVAEHTLETKEKAIQALLLPLEATLKQLDEQTRAMEKERAGAYGEIRTLVEGFNKEIPESLKSLRSETSQLITALRAPKTRGNWGELQLKRCVEYAGMVQYCSFVEQISARDEDDALLRPDMKVQLPNGRSIIVDAKTPLDAFLGAGDGGDGYAQALRFAAHAETVKSHLRKLSAKAYWKQFDNTPEFVICFLPSEAIFSAALEADPSLIEFSAHANVVMATPTTLIALLKAIAYGWQQSQITQNAKAIQVAGNDLYNKLIKAHEYFERLGKTLKSAVDNYNLFIGAVEGRQGAFSHARKLGSLVHSATELGIAEQLEAEPRLLTADDWTPQIHLPLPSEAEEAVATD
jgi:DNA recombination protein RmuC